MTLETLIGKKTNLRGKIDMTSHAKCKETIRLIKKGKLNATHPIGNKYTSLLK